MGKNDEMESSNGPEVRFLNSENYFDNFAKANPVSEGFICGGVFYSDDETYNKKIASLFQEIMTTKGTKEKVEEIFKKFINHLRDKNYVIDKEATYDKQKILQDIPKTKFDKNAKTSFPRKNGLDKFPVYDVIMSNKISKHNGFFILKMFDIEENSTFHFDIEAKLKILRAFKNVASPSSSQYIGDIIQLINIIKSNEGLVTDFSIQQLTQYLAPFEFQPFYGSYILTKAGLFFKKKSPKEVIRRIQESKNSKWEDLIFGIKEEIFPNLTSEEYKLKIEKWLLDLLTRIYDKTFMKKLRQDWKKFLNSIIQKEQENMSAIYLATNTQKQKNPLISYGEFYVPFNEMEIFVYYEDSITKETATQFINNFIKNNKTDICFECNNVHSISQVIPHFEKLKKISYNVRELSPSDSDMLLFNLFWFAAKMAKIKQKMEQKKKPLGIFFLLDTNAKQDNGSYPFWDYFREIYHFFEMPVQTINRNTINEIHKDATHKNAFISLFKDYKTLKINYDNLESITNTTMYVFLERSSSSFGYQSKNIYDFNTPRQKNFLYDIFLITFKDKNIYITLKHRFILLAGDINVDNEEIKKFIEQEAQKENTQFLFITTSSIEKSKIKKIIDRSTLSYQINKKSFFMQYKELPLAYIDNISNRNTNSCLVIHSSTFLDISHKLNLKLNNNNESIIAFKPPAPITKKFEDGEPDVYYHPFLQVFITNSFGWEKEEVYKFQTTLGMLSLLSVFQYMSESFNVPYKKLDLWKKKKDLRLRLMRNNLYYTVSLGSILYELLYTAKQIPLNVDEIQ